MTEQNLELMEQMKFKKIGRCWVGKKQGCFFKLYEDDDSGQNIMVEITIKPDESNAKITESLELLQKDQIVGSYGIENNALKIMFLTNNTQMSISDFLERMSNLLNESSCVNKCELCDSSSSTDFYINQNSTTLLCEDCSKKIEETMKIGGSNNYLVAFLGSFIGAVIGSILWIVIGAFGFYASIAGFAIAFCSFMGYEIFRGKKTIIGLLLNIFSIVVALGFAEYVGLFLNILKEYPGLQIMQFITLTPAMFSDPEFLKAILPNVGLGLLFAGLGSYGIIKNNYLQASYNQDVKIEKVVLEDA